MTRFLKQTQALTVPTFAVCVLGAVLLGFLLNRRTAPEVPATQAEDRAAAARPLFVGTTSYDAGSVVAGDAVDRTFHLNYTGEDSLTLGYSDGPCACSLQATAGEVSRGGSIDVPVSTAVPWSARGAWRQPVHLEYGRADGSIVNVDLEMSANVLPPAGAASRPATRPAPFISLGRLGPRGHFESEFRVRLARQPNGRLEDYQHTPVGDGHSIPCVSVDSFEVDSHDPEVLIFHYSGVAPAEPGFHRTTFNVHFTKDAPDGWVPSRVVRIPISLSVGEP